MKQLPYELVSAVQDLYDLYTRQGPRGPYRLSLFSDPNEIAADWPAAVQAHAERLDELARGVSCLLANNLDAAALPVIAEFWRSVCGLERELAGASWQQPAYYYFITQELRKTSGAMPSTAYRLFGEVLAVYLDILCAQRPDFEGDYAARIGQLRQIVIQTGDMSSASAMEGLSGSGSGSAD